MSPASRASRRANDSARSNPRSSRWSRCAGTEVDDGLGAGAGGDRRERRRGALRQVVGERAERAELAGGDQGARRPLVAERRRGGGEGEVAAGALAAGRHAPRAGAGARRPAGAPQRRAAAPATVVRQRPESGGARVAEPGARRAADDAAPGEDEVEQAVECAPGVHSRHRRHSCRRRRRARRGRAQVCGSSRAPASMSVCGATSERSPITASSCTTASWCTTTWRPRMLPARRESRPAFAPSHWMTPSSTAPRSTTQPSPMMSGPMSSAPDSTRQPAPSRIGGLEPHARLDLGALPDPHAAARSGGRAPRDRRARAARRSCSAGTARCCRRRSSSRLELPAVERYARPRAAPGTRPWPSPRTRRARCSRRSAARTRRCRSCTAWRAPPRAAASPGSRRRACRRRAPRRRTATGRRPP